MSDRAETTINARYGSAEERTAARREIARRAREDREAEAQRRQERREQAEKELTSELGREPTPHEIARRAAALEAEDERGGVEAGRVISQRYQRGGRSSTTITKQTPV